MYNSVKWEQQMETSGPITAINDQPVSICNADTKLLYNTRISNSLSLNLAYPLLNLAKIRLIPEVTLMEAIQA